MVPTAILKIFTIPKPFEGHIGTIQRNAIRSWARLRPECGIFVFGDETGSHEIVDELGIEQIVGIDRNEFGTPLLNSVFQHMERAEGPELLCYTNADIIFLSDFVDAVKRISESNSRFLMIGGAWDLDVREELDVESEDWEADIRERVTATGIGRSRYAMDYFVFPRDTIGDIPPFAVGRPGWDNWMIYRARHLRIPVVDVSASTCVIHQLHDYGHVKAATGERWEGPRGRA